MDGELKNLIKVWILAITSLIYCYYISSRIQKGLLRLLSLLPIFYIFIITPLNLYSFHFTGITSFFLLWLANFKLLLFAFNQGPLSPPNNIKLSHFILISCLPIKTKQNPPQKSKNNKNPSPKKYFLQVLKSILLTLTKVVILVTLLQVYEYRQHLHYYVVLLLYCFHLYLELEILLALCATPARFFGFELEPQFNEPYLATSLQDFWGYRWNLMVTSILCPTVYNPIRRMSFGIFGKKGAQMLGFIAMFMVSGLMHEVIYYYLARVPPTWEVTWFFVLQGVCVAIEVFLKKMVSNRWQLHRTVSGPLAVGFVTVTGFWLFFPQLLRNKLDEKALREFSIFVDFVKYVVT